MAVPVIGFSPMIRDWLGLPDVTGVQAAVAPVFGIEAVARERLSTAPRLGGRWDHENMMRTVREFEDLTRALQMARPGIEHRAGLRGPSPG